MARKAATEHVGISNRHTARIRMLVTSLTRSRTIDRQSKSPWGQKRVLWVNGISVEALTHGKISALQEEFKVVADEIREDLRRLRGKTLAEVKKYLGIATDDSSGLALRTLALGHHLKCWTLDMDGALGTGRLHDDEQIVIRDLRFH